MGVLTHATGSTTVRVPPLSACVHSTWAYLTPQQDFGLRSQRKTWTRSNGASWPRWRPGACWDRSLHVGGHAWSDGRFSWNTYHTRGSWSASRRCVCGSDALAHLSGRTSCRSLATYIQMDVHLRKHMSTNNNINNSYDLVICVFLVICFSCLCFTFLALCITTKTHIITRGSPSSMPWSLD